MTNSVWSEGFRHHLAVLQDRYGISKAQMARQCGLPPRTLENYFKGHKPGIEALISLSRGLRMISTGCLARTPNRKALTPTWLVRLRGLGYPRRRTRW